MFLTLYILFDSAHCHWSCTFSWKWLHGPASTVSFSKEKSLCIVQVDLFVCFVEFALNWVGWPSFFTRRGSSAKQLGTVARHLLPNTRVFLVIQYDRRSPPLDVFPFVYGGKETLQNSFTWKPSIKTNNVTVKRHSMNSIMCKQNRLHLPVRA